MRSVAQQSYFLYTASTHTISLLHGWQECESIVEGEGSREKGEII